MKGGPTDVKDHPTDVVSFHLFTDGGNNSPFSITDSPYNLRK